MPKPSVEGTAEGVPAVRHDYVVQDLRCALRIADHLMVTAEPTRQGRDLLVNAELHESLAWVLRQAGELAGRLDAHA